MVHFDELTNCGSVRKNGRETIVTRTIRVNGLYRIDIRSHFESAASGDLRPTAKGICFGLSQALEIRKFLDVAIAELRKIEPERGDDAA